MDYRVVYQLNFYSLLIDLCVLFLSDVNCIVGRDIVLTPKENLQLRGKSLFYEDDQSSYHQNQSAHPWERTLKHVTFVTLFGNSSDGSFKGNASELKRYAEFMRSPYIKDSNIYYPRFGDIVTLASGRLEITRNHTFRFMEGSCNYSCEAEQVWALWQVQKIRHRDGKQQFRYEMKFSVNPLQNLHNNDSIKRKVDEYAFWSNSVKPASYQQQNSQANSQQKPYKQYKTFIQKEDDYPHSFSKIIFPDEQQFHQKYYNGKAIERRAQENFGNDYQQVTPIPQTTFMHTLFYPPLNPLPPPRPPSLNIGEFWQFKGSKTTPRIEHFSNIFNSLTKPLMSFIPTTFKPSPNYHLRKPEIYQGNNKFIDSSKPNAPTSPFAHHYHHHYYVRPIEENEQKPFEFYKNYETTTAPDNKLIESQTFVPPRPLKIQSQIEVGQVNGYEENYPIRKTPQYMNNYYEQSSVAKEPFYIYTTSNEEENQSPTTKPFIQSEPMTDKIRYSDPDPLYYQSFVSEEPIDKISHTSYSLSYHETKADEVPDQLPKPDSVTALSVFYDNETSTSYDAIETSTSFSSSETSSSYGPTETTTSIVNLEESVNFTEIENTKKTEQTFKANSSDSETASGTKNDNYSLVSTEEPTSDSNYLTTAYSGGQFVSTSTTQSPLRYLSRYRLPQHIRTVATTERPVLKWKPKRKLNRNRNYNISETNETKDNKPKESYKYEKTEFPILKTPETVLPFTTPATILQGNPTFEVLTQKSISRSVSFKVGSSGEEVPIIVNDEQLNSIGNATTKSEINLNISN